MSTAHLDALDRARNFKGANMTRLSIPENENHHYCGAGLDFIMLLADAKYIARQAGSYTEEQRVMLFNVIAVLQCAIHEGM